MEDFRIDVPEADLVDLRDRLARTRWPTEAPAAVDQGTPRRLSAGVGRVLAGWLRLASGRGPSQLLSSSS